MVTASVSESNEQRARACTGSLVSLLIEREKFGIPICPVNRGLNHVMNFQSQLLCGRVNFFDDAGMLLSVANNPAFADFSSAYFKLRFYERDEATCCF